MFELEYLAQCHVLDSQGGATHVPTWAQHGT